MKVQSKNESGNTLPQTDLSIQQLEIICSLDLRDSPSAMAYQELIAADLVTVFEKGAKGVARDKWKASKYRKMTNQSTRESTYLKTKSIYSIHNWLRSGFSLVDRLINLFDVIGIATLNTLSYLVQASGFSHAVVLAVDIAIVAKAVFLPTGEEEKKLSYLERLSNILYKGERIKRMISAALWIGITLSAVYLTGGLSLVAGIAFHTFANTSSLICNIFHNIIKWFDLSNHRKLSKIINNELTDLVTEEKLWMSLIKEKLQRINTLNRYVINTPDNNSNTYAAMTEIGLLTDDIMDIEKRLYYIQEKYNNLNLVDQKIQKKLAVLSFNRTYAICTASIVVTGVALILFPPSAAILLAAVTAVFVVGSIADGFGKKIYGVIKNAFKTETPDNANTQIGKSKSSTATLHKKLDLTRSTPNKQQPTNAYVYSKPVNTSRFWAKQSKSAIMTMPANDSGRAFKMVM